MRVIRAFVIGAVFVMSFSHDSTAAAPSSVTVQGKLTNTSGVPLPSGSKQFTFRIFNASTVGTQVWPPAGGEVQMITSSTEGLWVGLVGAVTPLNDAVFSDTVRWLEINVDGTTLPRVRLVTGAFAFRVATVDGATGGNITSKVSIGSSHTNTGTDGFVVGADNIVSGLRASVTGGSENTASGSNSHIGGGENNIADTLGATVGGGDGNIASQSHAVVAGGSSNTSSGDRGAITGGHGNVASGPFSTVGAGFANIASGGQSAVVGGGYNKARGENSFVGGGGGVAGVPADSNLANGDNSVIVGGTRNFSSGEHSGILSGGGNRARGDFSVVGGGGGSTPADSNLARGDWSVVGGGNRNRAYGEAAVVVGGTTNRAKGDGSFVGGGGAISISSDSNTASGFMSAVVGGGRNLASSNQCFVGAGFGNSATGTGTAIMGGNFNTASGHWSSIPGGEHNVTAGRYSFAAGNRAKANHSGTFVWADSSDADFASTADEQFLIRATGGVGIGTVSPQAQLHVMESSAGAVTLNANSSAVFERSSTNFISVVGGYKASRGIIFADSSTSLSGAILYGSTAENGLDFRTNGSVRMVIDSLGNIGIGDNSPELKLDVVGNVGVTGTICATGAITGNSIACTSDERFKQNIEPLDQALGTVERLRGVRYGWKRSEFPERAFPAGEQIGLLAQEVQKVVPEAVIPMSDGYLAVDYARLVPLLIEGMKEQQRQIDALNATIKLMAP